MLDLTDESHCKSDWMIEKASAVGIYRYREVSTYKQSSIHTGWESVEKDAET